MNKAAKATRLGQDAVSVFAEARDKLVQANQLYEQSIEDDRSQMEALAEAIVVHSEAHASNEAILEHLSRLV